MISMNFKSSSRERAPFLLERQREHQQTWWSCMAIVVVQQFHSCSRRLVKVLRKLPRYGRLSARECMTVGVERTTRHPGCLQDFSMLIGLALLA